MILMGNIVDNPWGPKKAMRSDDNRLEWSQRRAYCACCWIDVRHAEHERFPQGIQIHELVGGPMRSLEPANYLTLCSRCHYAYHSGGLEGEDLTRPSLIYCKWESTCLEVGMALPQRAVVMVGGQVRWNPYRLKYLLRPHTPRLSALPQMVRDLPQWCIRERSIYGGNWPDGYALTESQFLSLGIESESSPPTLRQIIRLEDSGGDYANCMKRRGPLDCYKGPVLDASLYYPDPSP